MTIAEKLCLAVYAIGVAAGLIAILRGNLEVAARWWKTLARLVVWPLVGCSDLCAAAFGEQYADFMLPEALEAR